jgi:glyoxylase-like metal-dependent hydrolase (beta-lactamase superfamily II)
MKIGSITITPLFEANGDTVIQDCIEQATPDAANQIAWLKPHYVYADGKLKAQLQSFLIQTKDQNIVVDTGIGNGRERPGMPTWQNLNTDYLERLSKVFDPKNVDYVICTHFHSDHVGWNTTLVDGKWLPTFPNAQYIFSEDEYNYWKDKPAKEWPDDLAGFEESVRPIYEAGIAKLVPANYRLSGEISFIATPGHTPGHFSVLIESDGQSAVIGGDVIHHPCQMAHPEWGVPETDGAAAAESRKRLLERFAGTDTLFIGSHFAEPIGGRIVADGSGFKLV